MIDNQTRVLLRIDEIEYQAARIADIVELGFDKYNTYEFIQDMGERSLERVGEACVRLKNYGLEQMYPDITLITEAVGQRDVIAHQYDDLDVDLIWESLAVSVPALVADLRRIRPDFAEYEHTVAYEPPPPTMLENLVRASNPDAVLVHRDTLTTWRSAVLSAAEAADQADAWALMDTIQDVVSQMNELIRDAP